MKFSKLAFGLVALALLGCASNKQALEHSILMAENMNSLAQESKINTTTTASASLQLDSAKFYAENKEEDLAIALANKSALEYKLALLIKERDSLKKEDIRLENELRSDVERKLLYQNILDQESKGGK